MDTQKHNCDGNKKTKKQKTSAYCKTPMSGMFASIVWVKVICLTFTQDLNARNIILVTRITSMVEQSKLIPEKMTPNVIHC
jgi:hypothetical protein